MGPNREKKTTETLNSCYALKTSELQTDLVLSEQKKRPPKGGHVIAYTHAHRWCTVFRVFFSL